MAEFYLKILASLPQIVATLVLIVLLPLLKRIGKKIILKYGELAHKSEARMKQVYQVISVLLNVVFIIGLGMIWGVKPENFFGTLTALFAVIGVALFAQWSILSNITAGVVMFFSAPYRVGDQIKIIDKDTPISAVIENISTFYTHIRSDQGELIVLPNNIFLQKIVALINTESDGDENIS